MASLRDEFLTGRLPKAQALIEDWRIEFAISKIPTMKHQICGPLSCDDFGVTPDRVIVLVSTESGNN